MPGLNLATLFQAVFDPQPDDRVCVMIDQPHGPLADHADWSDRRAMAADWRHAFTQENVAHVHPLLTYPATGANNGDLPQEGECAGNTVRLADVWADSTLLIAMTQFSATAPLARYATRHLPLRVASMPGVLRRMEQTALAADYRAIARKTHALAAALTRAERAEVVFATGDRIVFDLRHRTGHADDGACHPGKPFPLINLPSGEAFIVPYEGEQPGTPSQTAGTIPMQQNGEPFTLEVVANRIRRVHGDGPRARAFAQYLDEEPARANIAELGLGCNECAVVRGAVIEDEKAGLHWAYGRSEHLGGTIGPDAFSAPDRVVHQDIVYATDSPIHADRCTLFHADDTMQVIMDNGQYQWPEILS